MKVAFLSPLPPVKSGIAHYSAMILPELAREHDVTAVVAQDAVDPVGVQVMRVEEFREKAATFDRVICQLGNNVHHEFVYRWAVEHPSVIVLHEVVMHHLAVELTLARGDAAGLRDALGANHGDAGRAIADARVMGVHGELANFLYPASTMLAAGAEHVIVHNQWARGWLEREGVQMPVTVVPHPYVRPARVSAEDWARLRTTLGFSENDIIVGVFGFITEAKRPEVVFEAFGAACRKDSRLRLLFVGEPAPHVDLACLASRFEVPDGLWRATGYVADSDFDRYLELVDRVVALRYPSAGETSGALVRVFAIGRPVAVSDYAQFSEFPRSIVSKIPFDDEMASLLRFMLAGRSDSTRVALAQSVWLRDHASMQQVIAGYDEALRQRSVPAALERAAVPILPLFPTLEARIDHIVRSQGGRITVTVRIANRGTDMIPAIVWGEPLFLVVASLEGRAGD